AGKLFKIPTFVLQHGMAGYELGFYPFSADYFIAFGEESKHRLKNFGLPEEKVFALGHPQFEKYLNQRTKRTKIISYITTTARSTDFLPEVDPSKKNQKDILRIIFRAMKNFPKYKLIVKGREGWDMNNLAKQIAKEENFHNFEVVEKTDSSKLLRNSDVLLVNNSTMVLDALLLKKDVISVTCKGISHFYNSPFTKPIKKVFDEKQLGKEIRKCLGRNKNYPNFLEKRLPKEWGGSSKKISEFISSKIG
ncbi:MAG: hypothetical protein Q8P15_02250, partial [Nanoarchaeota archaeon]|nr:hypothetical protein [Nanoarchaeota archaeon]